MVARSGGHDRRGFEWVMRLTLLIGLPTSLLTMVFYSWKLGLAMLMFGCIAFITMEAVSAPPANRPEMFIMWARRQNRRRPVLVCLGDSLTHGNRSASYTPEIPIKLSTTLGMTPSDPLGIFMDPLWVVNAGQNMITSYTILNERLNGALGCYPDYILIFIGTNDVRGIYKKSWGRYLQDINDLPSPPSMASFESNLTKILDFIYQSSPMVQVGLCTLPPLGEDLKSPANDLIRQANEAIQRVAKEAGEKVSVINVYSRLEAIIEKKRRGGVSVDFYFFLALVMNPLFHLASLICTWDLMSSWVGNVVLADGLNLNERGRDQVVDAVVEWLVSKNVAKAIAVKS